MTEISLEPRAAKLTKSGRVNTPKGRLAFVQIAEPKLKKDAKPGAKPKYSIAILMPKGADLTALKALRSTSPDRQTEEQALNALLDNLR